MSNYNLLHDPDIIKKGDVWVSVTTGLNRKILAVDDDIVVFYNPDLKDARLKWAWAHDFLVAHRPPSFEDAPDRERFGDDG